MSRKKTPNIDFIIGMAEDYVNGGDHIDFSWTLLITVLRSMTKCAEKMKCLQT